MNGISEFFSFILSPVTMFLSGVAVQFQSASTYVLNFFMSFLSGLMNVLQAIVDLLNFGNY